ncbi:hypothetical protein KR093_002853 [Drosophila rubida]|uniref:Serpin domain-containing protein n=1 Tax=Drosophila rubida TaxID=30044 RepID=A0AAD4JZ06_9MUSC|nr:hypothetical protein KR093_002853 [Drosophila rubida]
MLHTMCTISMAMVCLLSIGIVEAVTPYQVDIAVAEKIAEDVMDFGLNLTRKLIAENKKTILISPLSISTALAILLLGSNGKSFSELSKLFQIKDPMKLHAQFGLMLRDVQQAYKETTSSMRAEVRWRFKMLSLGMKLSEQSKEHQEIQVTNGVFVQQGNYLNQDYRQVLYQFYNSELYPIDFKSDLNTTFDAINTWLSQKTKDRIKKLPSRDLINRSERMMLINTVYFNAQWEISFLDGYTVDRSFYPNGNESELELSFPFMVAIGQYPHYRDNELGCDILGIPYAGQMTTMYIIRPDKSSRTRLAKFANILNATLIDRLIGKMKRIRTLVRIPKMHLTGYDRLRDVLETMGIKSIFKNDDYDLSLITLGGSNNTHFQSDPIDNLDMLESERQLVAKLKKQKADLYVSEIVHLLDLNLRETGTEATTPSTNIMLKTLPSFTFIADTPFIVLVRNDITKLPIFYGIINEPPSSL